ncbi:MAG: glycerophosphodiester phosphodiesterase family protein [Promethearchaeota archaeon]
MRYYTENTLTSSEKAVSFGAGIETNVLLTKDKNLICFLNKSFQIGQKWYNRRNLTLKEL